MKKFEYVIENEMTGASATGLVESANISGARARVKDELALRRQRTVFPKGLKIKSVKEVA